MGSESSLPPAATTEESDQLYCSTNKYKRKNDGELISQENEATQAWG